MRTARFMVAAIVGATAGAVIVFSLLDRPVAEELVAARTLVGPDASWPVTADTSAAAQQPTEPQQQIKLPAELQNSTEQKAPLVLAAGVKTRPQQSELATTLASQHPTSAAALAEAPAVEDMPSAQTPNNTVAVAPDPASTSQPQSKGRSLRELRRATVLHAMTARAIMLGVTTGRATDMGRVTDTNRASALRKGSRGRRTARATTDRER